MPERSRLVDNSSLNEGLRSDGELATPSILGRWRSARQRYGHRALAIAIHRSLFQWPKVRSKTIRLKLRLLYRSEISASTMFGKGVFFMIPGGILAISDNTWIGDRCFIEAWPNPTAEITIGANCYLAHDIHLGSFGKLSIGNNVRIAEFTSLRDTSHNYKDKKTNIDRQGDTVGELIIEDDVWIGQGCLILGSISGTLIGRGAVIGAHSVVKESIPAYAIAVGAPARVVGYRE